MKDNIKPFMIGVFLTMFAFSIIINVIAFNNGLLDYKNAKPVLSGVGYNKKDAEQMLNLVESVSRK